MADSKDWLILLGALGLAALVIGVSTQGQTRTFNANSTGKCGGCGGT